MTTPLLAVDHIARRFGAVTALADVSFEVMPGEVVALLGDNGAGKSTLIKIIAGTQPPSSGRLLWNGSEVTMNGPADAKALGIETVYQDLSLAPNIDVVGNFFMGRELTRSVGGIRWLREKEMEDTTRSALARLGTKNSRCSCEGGKPFRWPATGDRALPLRALWGKAGFAGRAVCGTGR